jgi:uncharacterized membrane protein YoaK (UPF0700 family)
MSFLTDIRQIVVPDGTTRHGPLAPLLVAMTFVTGLVDAFSYLLLGRVFVANMTGNVVLLGFALVGGGGGSRSTSPLPGGGSAAAVMLGVSNASIPVSVSK